MHFPIQACKRAQLATRTLKKSQSIMYSIVLQVRERDRERERAIDMRARAPSNA